MRLPVVAIAILAISAVAGTTAAAEPPEQSALHAVNHYRHIAGLPPVVLDAALSAGCMQHADYMRRNAGTDAVAGLNAHIERPELPGASAAGAACGKSADLFPGVADLGVAVDGWMAGIYHRRPILDPDLARIGVGYAPLPDGSLVAALMLVDTTGGPVSSTWPVAYPTHDQTGVPLQYANEVPNPVPAGARGGYPVTLQFPPFEPLTDVRATLIDAAGAQLPIALSDPEHPATSFGQFGLVSVIPIAPLLPGGHYAVQIEATWRGTHATWRWTFATVELRHVDAADVDGLLAAVGVPSLVHGTVFYGGMMDPDTAFLEIGHGDGTRFQLASIVIPAAVWTQLAGKAAPSSWVGKAVDVETLPELYQHRYLNLPIATARQLHVACCAP